MEASDLRSDHAIFTSTGGEGVNMLVGNVLNFIKGRMVFFVIDLSMPYAIIFKNSDI